MVYACLETNSENSQYQRVYDLGKACDDDAFFYKLRRMEEYAQGDCNRELCFFGLATERDLLEAKTTKGRIYDPNNNHKWQTNLAWVLGLVHKGRTILLNSKVLAHNIWRVNFRADEKNWNKNINSFSAFTREIAAVFKAGYELSINDNFTLQFSPNRTINFSILKLSNIDPTLDDIENVLKLILMALFKKAAESFATENLRENPMQDFFCYCWDKCFEKIANEDDSEEENDDEYPNIQYYSPKSFHNFAYCDDCLEDQSTFTLINMATALSQKSLLYSSDCNKPAMLTMINKTLTNTEVMDSIEPTSSFDIKG